MAAWKAGGDQWKSWSSRLVTATLQLGGRRAKHLHILSCYAPTFCPSRDDKDQFFNNLQEALDTEPSSDPYVMLGDFNANMGSRSSSDDLWADVRGPHGLMESNDAGKELLNFLALNEETSMQHLV